MATPEERLKELRERFAALQAQLRDRQGVMVRLQDATAQREQRIQALKARQAELLREIAELGGGTVLEQMPVVR